VVLGAGFGGLELSSLLSEALGQKADVTLIDKSDHFMFGFSKLDIMFGHGETKKLAMPYKKFIKPGVRFRQEVVKSIDPHSRRVVTNHNVYDADQLVVALGADYDFDATPGLAEVNEFYSVAGAEKLRDALTKFKKGRALIGVCGAPFKCPPAPSECALMLHDFLTERGVRQHCEINFTLPLSAPVPPSPETSKALIAAFAERNIAFQAQTTIVAIDAKRKIAKLDNGGEIPFDLFFGVPKHSVPRVVIESGLAENGWISVNPRTLETKFDGVYGLGDGANTGTPKAGVFAERAAKAVASALIAKVKGGEASQYDGHGVCYIEFGAGRIGKVEVDFFAAPHPVGKYYEPSAELRADKNEFGSSRRARWFGMG
jgi:sulfide:quinone oxidoreductase